MRFAYIVLPDPYENCYAVVRGTKTFVLLPPIEYYCVHGKTYHNCYGREHIYLIRSGVESSFPCATYVMDNNGKLQLEPLSPTMKTPCTPVDPANPDLERYPRFGYAKPITVTVREGEMLYLPGMIQFIFTMSMTGVSHTMQICSVLDASSYAGWP